MIKHYHKSAMPPPDPKPYQLWLDTSTGEPLGLPILPRMAGSSERGLHPGSAIWKQRNSTNDAWIIIGVTTNG